MAVARPSRWPLMLASWRQPHAARPSIAPPGPVPMAMTASSASASRSSSSSSRTDYKPKTVKRFVQGDGTSSASASKRVKPGSRPDYKPKTVKRFIPEDMKAFVQDDGRLMTNQEMRDFLVEHDIEPDNGRMERFAGGTELSRVASEFGAMSAYSPRHILHPHHLIFFDPRGHPLAPKIRADYARKIQEQPFWVYVTAMGGCSAVVRTKVQRKLTRSVYEALDKLGYRTTTLSNAGPDKVWGTLWVTLHNPLKAAGQSPEWFGRVMATALVANCHRHLRHM
ncbi:hypothetical protein E4U42_003247 [Claviceps africana]|uniref:Uncharacterized protein n=1 Tax=Claviceps africana TaxID=83212 RepID=A0A8K0J776_9HYPO|nr:hypothetical protein E4U42_003247 [Claviceps africana]